MRLFLRLLRYALPYKMQIGLSLLCMVGVSFFGAVSIGALLPVFNLLLSPTGTPRELAVPRGLRPWLEPVLAGTQEFMTAHPLTSLTILGVSLLGVFLLKGFCDYARGYLTNSVVEGIKRNVRDHLYSHLHTLSLRFYTENPTGGVMSRLTFDVDALGTTVTSFFSTAIKEPLNILAYATLLFLIHWKLALIACLAFPLALYPITVFGRKVRTRSKRVQERRAEMNTMLQETLSGMRIVKAFGTEEHEKQRFFRANREITRGLLRIMRVEALSSPLLEVVGASGIVLVVWVGGSLVLRQVLSPGELIAFIGALGALFEPVKRTSQVNINIQRGLAGVARVFEVLDLEPEVRESEAAVALPRMREEITFHQVSFGYDPESLILSEVTFTAKMGEIVALVGSSGVGKSTLVNLLPRFYDPTAGWIALDGHDIRTVTVASLRGQIGIVTQETILFDDAVADNIAYGDRQVNQTQIRRAAEIANALEFIERLPQGFDTVIGERGVRLSGGQRQRIAIARAIVRDPAILILDEATSALDAESERAVQEALNRAMENRTTFVIAHRLSTIIRADKILVLDAGRIVEMGTHAELVARDGVYRRLYQSQFQSGPEGV